MVVQSALCWFLLVRQCVLRNFPVGLFTGAIRSRTPIRLRIRYVTLLGMGTANAFDELRGLGKFG
jgi:hypothetical protein